MNSTRNHSIATNWRKDSVVGASIVTSRMELAWVVVLQILGVDGLMWSTHRWSQNDLSPVRIFQTYWERSTNSFCIESILLASYDGWNLFAQVRTSGYRPLDFDHVRVEMHEIQDHSKKRSWIPWQCFLMHLFFKLWAWWYSFFCWVLPYLWPWGRPFLIT